MNWLLLGKIALGVVCFVGGALMALGAILVITGKGNNRRDV